MVAPRVKRRLVPTKYYKNRDLGKTHFAHRTGESHEWTTLCGKSLTMSNSESSHGAVECTTCQRLASPGRPGDRNPLGPVIRDELRRQGLTQADMARALGYTQKHISMVLSGKDGVTLNSMVRMLDFVGLELYARRRN